MKTKMMFIKRLLRYGVPGFFACLMSAGGYAQKMPLPKEWKFTLGDNSLWAGPSFDDSKWVEKPVGSSWSATGMKDNVYAWYRIRIHIPTAMKMAGNRPGIKLHLGKIDDVDQTFFNGKLIGQTGALPPAYESKWDVERVYIIPDSLILWNQDNSIAVRVFSPDTGGVGMYEGPYNFGPVGWTDSVSIDTKLLK